MAKEKAVVLLSSGLDSTVNLYWAKQVLDVKLVVTFDYGQRAAKKEIEIAKKLTEKMHISHRVLELPFFLDFNRSSLIDRTQKVPTASDVQIDSLEQSQETAKSVWVPNRNGIFLNIAAGYAESLDADYVIPGFNLEEAATFADNSEEYMRAASHSLEFSTSNHVRVKCFTSAMTKTEIVKKAQELQVDFSLMWPCYFAEEKWCGECESCKRSKRALHAGGVNTSDFFRS